MKSIRHSWIDNIKWLCREREIEIEKKTHKEKEIKRNKIIIEHAIECARVKDMEFWIENNKWFEAIQKSINTIWVIWTRQ